MKTCLCPKERWKFKGGNNGYDNNGCEWIREFWQCPVNKEMGRDKKPLPWPQMVGSLSGRIQPRVIATDFGPENGGRAWRAHCYFTDTICNRFTKKDLQIQRVWKLRCFHYDCDIVSVSVCVHICVCVHVSACVRVCGWERERREDRECVRDSPRAFLCKSKRTERKINREGLLNVCVVCVHSSDYVLLVRPVRNCDELIVVMPYTHQIYILK